MPTPLIEVLEVSVMSRCFQALFFFFCLSSLVHAETPVSCRVDLVDQRGDFMNAFTVHETYDLKGQASFSNQKKALRSACESARTQCLAARDSIDTETFLNPYCRIHQEGGLREVKNALPIHQQNDWKLSCKADVRMGSFALGIGYIGGKGHIGCNDGTGAWIDLDGINILSVGGSTPESYGSRWAMEFSGGKTILGVDSTYHGVGIQLSAIPLFMGEAYVYAGGDYSLFWIAPRVGLEIGLGYRGLGVEIEDIPERLQDVSNRTDKFTRPSLAYSVLPTLVKQLELRISPWEEGSDHLALTLHANPSKLNGQDIPLELPRSTPIAVRMVQESAFNPITYYHNVLLGDLFETIEPAWFDEPTPYRHQFPAVIDSADHFRPGETYCVEVRYSEFRFGTSYFPAFSRSCFEVPREGFTQPQVVVSTQEESGPIFR